MSQISKYNEIVWKYYFRYVVVFRYYLLKTLLSDPCHAKEIQRAHIHLPRHFSAFLPSPSVPTIQALVDYFSNRPPSAAVHFLYGMYYVLIPIKMTMF
jgi:hypothetical protein